MGVSPPRNSHSYEQYDRVHIVPMHDTLPTTYNYNLFRDYIRPYLERHYLDVFSIYDTFFYKGIQFKIMGVNPENVMYGKGRISCNTFIYMNGAIKPTFFDVISKESMNYIKCLPFEYKPYAVLNILQHLDTDSLLRLFPSSNGSMQGDRTREEGVLRLLTKHRYVFGKAESLTGGGGKRECVDIYEDRSGDANSDEGRGGDTNSDEGRSGDANSDEGRSGDANSDEGRSGDANSDEGRSGDNDEAGDGEDDGDRNRVGQERDGIVSRKNLINDQCAVCFEYFQDFDKCIKLTCLHTYHWKCVKNWFKFNLTCPCCRHKLAV
ncbi:RING zinc finger protein, putative [Plasmodium ovale wallikeri]|uniref:RING-type E3 ubiquitin transferase n=1 Tax=Plasmodium ovale wallikeri TaxID=864142 RepID=A0A1A8YSA1_PLAOA|nr:RING zinc finger protein, putative [Plasmodium ovale wallikeri]SBT34518.1 RING zinc finger protein, putative [Plasmodium ovale wallikeri]